MATNQSLLHKLLVLLGGYLVIAAVQIWGVFWESLKMLVFNFGGPAREVVLEAGVPEHLVALCYQLGVLILPALSPVVVWLIGAWREIEPYAATWTRRED